MVALAGTVRPALAAVPICIVPGDSTTIQGAVDNPACTSVIVAAGIYTENVVITRSMTLQSADALAAIIHGGGVGTVIRIDNTEMVTVEGFIITGGDSSINNGEGGGIAVRRATALVLNNLIEGNVASSDPATRGRGGGIDVFSSTVHIISNTIQSNLAYSVTAPVSGRYGIGGGIWISSDSAATITDNQILSNTAAQADTPGGISSGGGGIGGSTSGTVLTIDGNTIRGNMGNAMGGVGRGGGVYLFEVGRAAITNNTILQNTAAISATSGTGGGIWASSAQTITVADNWVENNTALISGPDGQGGGIYLYTSGSGANLMLTGNWVMSNTAIVIATGSNTVGGPYAAGGGIRIWGGGTADDTLTMKNNHLIGNVAARTMTVSASIDSGHAEGGGIASGEISTTLIISNVVQGNIAVENLSQNGNGSDTWGGRAAGGGIYISNSDTVALSDNQIRNNVTAQEQAVTEVNAGGEGGGIALADIGIATVSTNTIISNVVVMTGSITSTVARNYGFSGGGISANCWDKPGCKLYFVGNDILSNVTAHNLIMSGSNIQGDSSGGGIDATGTVVAITDNRIMHNTAALSATSAYGGGISASGTQTLTVVDNWVVGNTALVTGKGGQGGGIHLRTSGSGSNLMLTGNWVMSNTAIVIATGSNTVGGPYAAGGGIQIWGGDAADDTLTMKNNHLIGNVAARTMTISATINSGNSEGGGLRVGRISTSVIISNVVQGNIAVENLSQNGDGRDTWGGRAAGGGIYLNDGDTVTLTDNRIRENVTVQQQAVTEVNAGAGGGGIALANIGIATVSTNTLTSNVVVVTGSITSNTGRSYYPGGGGIFGECWDKPGCKLSFAGNNISDNVTAHRLMMNGTNAQGGAGGGGIDLRQSVSNLQSNIISGNTSSLNSNGWGGGVNTDSSTVTMEGNLILGNGAIGNFSDGIWLWESTLTSTNDIFAHNYGAVGAADGGKPSNVTITNGTLYDNGETGVSVNNNSRALITNTIIYSHTRGLNNDNSPSSTLIGNYNLLSNTTNYAGGVVAGANDIVGQDPMFVNVAANDFHLSSSSPAIDKGTSIGAPSVDYEGDTRDGMIDIGADEYVSQGLIYLPTILKTGP